MLAEVQGVLHGAFLQQLGLGQFRQFVALGQAQLQLQGDAAVHHLDLQGVAEGAHQLAAAQGVGEVVVVVAGVEENQAAAVAEGEQLALVQSCGLFQAVAVALQQVHQAAARQAPQLFLVAQLHGQHGAGVRQLWLGFFLGLFGDFGGFFGEVLGERLSGHGRFVVQLVLGEDVLVELVLVARQVEAGFAFVLRLAGDVVGDGLGGLLRGFRQGRRGCLGRGLARRGSGLGGRRLLRHQACLELAGQVADLVLQAGAGGGVVRVAQPHAQLQQRGGDVAAQAQAEGQGEQQQDQADQAHALQADHHRLLELFHVQADAQLAGHDLLEGDLRRVDALAVAQQALLGPRAGLGQGAAVGAVDGGVGHQRVLGQVAQQHVEAEDVVGHQQLGGRGRGLGGQALAHGVGLLVHGLLELHAHHPGVDQQRRRHQHQAVDGDAQGDGHPALAQGVIQQQEEIIGLDGRGPGHSGLGLL